MKLNSHSFTLNVLKYHIYHSSVFLIFFKSFLPLFSSLFFSVSTPYPPHLTDTSVEQAMSIISGYMLCSMQTTIHIALNASAGTCVVHLRCGQERVATFTYTKEAWRVNLATLE